MSHNGLFERFDNCGILKTLTENIPIHDIPWQTHPKAPGVAYKLLIDWEQTNTTFQYYMVRIDPHQEVLVYEDMEAYSTCEVMGGGGVCSCGGTELELDVGVLLLLPNGKKHTILAGDEGLQLFSKVIVCED